MVKRGQLSARRFSVDYASEYRRLHRNEKYFAGLSLMPHIDAIAELIRKHNAQSLLDYGCGKGEQYTFYDAHMRLGVMPALYDIGVNKFSTSPIGTFDGVICTDVMEHIAEPDIPIVLGEIFGYARKFVFFSISTKPARDKRGKRLSDGNNAHLTVRNREWWEERIAHKNLDVVAVYED